MHIEETVEIAAPPERIWDVTLDLVRWPAWNPTVTDVQLLDGGAVGPGTRARLTQPGNRPGVWTVRRMEPTRIFEWDTRALGMHVTALHDIQPIEGGTRVVLSIDVDGPTAPLLGWLVARVSRRFLPQEAAALREECTRG